MRSMSTRANYGPDAFAVLLNSRTELAIFLVPTAGSYCNEDEF